MKLLTKTSVLYLLFALPVLAVCSFIAYHLIYTEVINNTDERLMKDYEQVVHILKTDTLTNYTSLNEEILINKTNTLGADKAPLIYDTLIYDNYEEEELPFRVLKATQNGRNIVIRKMYLEADDFAESIMIAIITLFGLLVVGFFIINYFISKKIWRPFYKTLEILNQYNLNNGAQLAFDTVNTAEFNQLNRVLNSMTAKMYADYINQKQFAENAAHEMQTPLAVIKSKIELLIQSEKISAPDMDIIQSIYNSTTKLSQLNKALLLLSKIENKQFTNTENVNISGYIDKALENYAYQITQKNISIEKKSNTNIALNLNTILADVLFGNMIQNAVRHNINNGKIMIQLNTQSIIITNTGETITGNAHDFFERFKKGNQSADSLGLGLAIIKQICELYNFTINYTYENNLHTIAIHFNHLQN